MINDDTDGGSPSDLAKVHQDSMRAANASWTETDKLYVSVCSALLALATIFGHRTEGSGLPITVVGVLVLLLSFNWVWLICRYRGKIRRALNGLATENASSKIKAYFAAEEKRFRKDPSDYFIASIVLLMSLTMIFPAVCVAISACRNYM